MDFKKVLNEMISGTDISLVDPDIYPHLTQLISNYLDTFRAQNDVIMISKLNFYQNYIDSTPRRMEISAMLSHPPPPPPPKIPALTEAQVNEQVDYLLSTEHLKYYPQEELDLIAEGLRKRKAGFIAQGDYLRAQRTEQFTNALSSFGQLGTVEKLQTEKVSDIEQKLNEAKNQLNEHKRQFENFYSMLLHSAKNDIAVILKRHESELSKIEDLRSQPLPPNFQKHSNQYIDYMRKYDSCIRSRRYEQAGKFKQLADQLEEQENQQNRVTYNKKIDQKLTNVRMQHQKEVEARKRYWKSEEIKLVNQANKEIEIENKAVEHLEKNLKNAKQAKVLASNMKESKRNKVSDSFETSSLPPLTSNGRRIQAIEHRQRAILNHRIYSRLPNKSYSSAS